MSRSLNLNCYTTYELKLIRNPKIAAKKQSQLSFLYLLIVLWYNCSPSCSNDCTQSLTCLIWIMDKKFNGSENNQVSAVLLAFFICFGNGTPRLISCVVTEDVATVPLNSLLTLLFLHSLHFGCLSLFLLYSRFSCVLFLSEENLYRRYLWKGTGF